MVDDVRNAMFLITELTVIPEFFSSEGFVEWGKFIRNINKLVVNHGLDFRAMSPLSDHHQARSRLLRICWRTANGISYARWFCTG